MDLDYIFSCKYQSPEPAAASWSAEETAPCTAAFSGTPLTGSTPLTVQFTDASTTASGAIDTWLWDFGDGSPASTWQHPAHTYTTIGCYNITLLVTNTLGMYDWENKTAYVCAGNVTPTPTTVAPTPTGTPPTQLPTTGGRISPFGFVVLACIDIGVILYGFADNENRNYMHVFAFIIGTIISFLLGMFLITGYVSEEFVVTAAEVTVNSSVLSTYETQLVPVSDAGFGFLFIFIGVLMLIYSVLASLEAMREIMGGN
jgi:PKD repeat protein